MSGRRRKKKSAAASQASELSIHALAAKHAGDGLVAFQRTEQLAQQMAAGSADAGKAGVASQRRRAGTKLARRREKRKRFRDKIVLPTVSATRAKKTALVSMGPQDALAAALPEVTRAELATRMRLDREMQMRLRKANTGSDAAAAGRGGKKGKAGKNRRKKKLTKGMKKQREAKAKQNLAKDIEHFSAVLMMPQFNANPVGALQEHLNNTIIHHSAQVQEQLSIAQGSAVPVVAQPDQTAMADDSDDYDDDDDDNDDFSMRMSDD